MKQKICDILKWLGCLLLVILGIICCLGLLLALIGLIFNCDPLYFIGLLLASPLFIFILPGLLLLLVLFNIFFIISCFRKPRPDSNTNEQYSQ